MKDNIDKFDSEGRLPEVLDLTEGKDQCEDLFMTYLCRHVMNSWPDISHKAAFYSISWNRLENWLLAPSFHFDDAETLLDLCSAWIMHDLKTRYKLIPQVALAIKRYGLPDYEDYKMETPADLGNISKKSIRDKLSHILSSVSLIPASTGEPRKFEEWPVFVTSERSERGHIFHVLNVNFDRMATTCFRIRSCESFCGSIFPMSTAIVKDNLFIVCVCGIRSPSTFLAYNFPSNKFIELGTDSRIGRKDTLLNRGNELFCCSFQYGSMLKYSFELNRWMSFSKSKSSMKNVRFTSDGDKIYRLYQEPGSQTDPNPRYNVEWYDFEKNLWILLSSLPSQLPIKRFASDRDDKEEVIDFTVINDTDPAILFKDCVLRYDLNSQTWLSLKLPDDQYSSSVYHDYSVIAQGENGLVQIFNNQLYHYSNSKRAWELKKEIGKPGPFIQAPYHNIVVVNRPMIRVE